jgi:transcriptional regulator with XRE-family HTH domain
MPEKPEEDAGSPTEFVRQVKLRLAEARDAAGLTQKQASAKLGRGANAVQEWESGKSLPNAEGIVEACRLYGCSTDWLLGLSKSPTIRPGVAIVNRRAESAYRSAANIAEVWRAAEQLHTDLESGVSIGYLVPDDYEVVPEDEYEKRRQAVQAIVKRLHPTLGTRMVRLLREVFSLGKKAKNGGGDASRQ